MENELSKCLGVLVTGEAKKDKYGNIYLFFLVNYLLVRKCGHRP